MTKSTKNSYNVLMQVNNQNEAERLISVFRSGGLAVRVHRITSEQDFNESINDTHWDLLIADNRHPEVSLQFSLNTLKKQKHDIPVLLLTDDVSRDIRDQAFKLGLQDVIEKNDNIHFIHSALREMQNVRSRINCRRLSHDFQELKKRADKLLAESDDAIAYVSDGILIKVNDNFASFFGYTADELDCASIIDLVSSSDQEKFKNVFRHFSKGSTEQAELAFKARKKDKEEFDTAITLAHSVIDGEPCTQLNLRTGTDAATAGGSGIIDSATELHNRYYLADQITTTALQIGKNIRAASLLIYRLDASDRLLDDIGFSGIDLLIRDLATTLQKDLEASDSMARLGDDAIAVIRQLPADKALSAANDTLRKIEDHICELKGRTLQYTCTCAVLQLNNKDASVMLDNAFAGISHIRLSHDKNHADIFTPAAPEAGPVNADDVANIEEAIELGYFKILYQPIMSLQGDTLENYEATLWFTDDSGDNYPENLIKKAGNSKLDRWIILETTKALAMHRAHGHNTRLIINLTSNGLLDESLAGWLGVATKAANLNSDLLIFQFREDDIKNNLKAAIKSIGALRAAKFRVSVGMFGKDEDPFKLLKHIPLDMVKLDTALAHGDSKALKAVIDNAKTNKLQTVVPDVDNASTLASMWQMGTHYIQGSYLQLPSPVMNYEFAEIA